MAAAAAISIVAQLCCSPKLRIIIQGLLVRIIEGSTTATSTALARPLALRLSTLAMAAAAAILIVAQLCCYPKCPITQITARSLLHRAIRVHLFARIIIVSLVVTKEAALLIWIEGDSRRLRRQTLTRIHLKRDEPILTHLQFPRAFNGTKAFPEMPRAKEQSAGATDTTKEDANEGASATAIIRRCEGGLRRWWRR